MNILPVFSKILEKPLKKQLQLPNYNIEHQIRKPGKGGGACIFIHESLWFDAYLILFQHNNMLVKQKSIIKNLSEEYLALKDLESRLYNKKVAKKWCN